MDVDAARRLAQALLEPVGDRWAHTRGVARQAVRAGAAVAAGSRPDLIAAAWLHDVGYAPQLVDTGLHALDGARHLRSGWKPLVCQLVAYHSAAPVEAEERGLRAELRQFACPDEFLLDA